MLTTPTSVAIAAFTAAAILALWLATALRSPQRTGPLSLAAAAAGAAGAGLVAGSFYALFDYPIIWP